MSDESSDLELTEDTTIIKEGSKHRAYLLTINNFTQEEEEKIMQLPSYKSVDECVACEEHLDVGTPHIHAYVHLSTAWTFSSIKKKFPRAHIDLPKGKRNQILNYIFKDGNILINFNRDIDTRIKVDNIKGLQMLHDIQELDENDFAQKYPTWFINNENKFDSIKSRFLIDKLQVYNGDLKLKNFWIYGPTGTGKSTLARTILPLSKICVKNWSKWFFGYKIAKHKRILIEDWPKYVANPTYDIMTQYLKIWSDRYPFVGESKGGHVTINPSVQFIVTSNYSLEEAFPEGEDLEALKRRFTEINLINYNDIQRYMTLLN